MKARPLTLRRFLSGLLFVASILACCLSLFPIVAYTQGIRAADLMGKPLSEVEAVLGKAEYGEGSGPKDDYRMGYRFHVKGFDHVGIGYAGKRGMTGIIFVFPPQMIINRRMALAVVGLPDPPLGCAAAWYKNDSGEWCLNLDL
jgi:hypothetical protein